MKIAVVAVTKQGAALARRLADSLRAYGRDTTEYAQAGKTFDDRQTPYTSVMLLVKDLFHVVDGLVFVAATGIEWNKVRSLIQNGRRNLKICMEKNSDGDEE